MMQRYFFDLDNRATQLRDEVGIKCRDLEAVRAAAIAALPEMAKEELPDGDRHEFAVRVRDAEGTYLFQAVLTFKADWLVPPPK